MRGYVIGGGGGGAMDPTGSTSVPIYLNAEGEPAVVTSIDNSLVSGSGFNQVYYITFSASGWSGSQAPYTQTKTVDTSGTTLPYTSDSVPVVSLYVTDVSSAGAKTLLENYGYITKVETGTNQLKATCSSDKPTVDITLMAKGF